MRFFSAQILIPFFLLDVVLIRELNAMSLFSVLHYYSETNKNKINFHLVKIPIK